MNNKQEYYSDFSKYLYEKKHKKYFRLSIFGREKDGMLEVFILKANPKDKFYKSIAKQVYFSHTEINNGYHPIIQNIIIEEGNSAKYTFKLFTDLFFRKFIYP